MKQRHILGAVAVFTLMVFALMGPVAAEDTDPEPELETDDGSGNDFGSREDLVEFLSQASNEDAAQTQLNIDDLNADLAELEIDTEAAQDDLNAGELLRSEGNDELAAAQDELNDAITDEEIAVAQTKFMDAQTKIADAETQILDASDELSSLNSDKEMRLADLELAQVDLADAAANAAGIQAIVDDMSDDQVYWSNQKFQNAKASGLVVDIPLEDLEKFVDYNFHQISAATKAFEAEAKFAGLAEKFDRLGIVFPDTPAFLVQHSQIELRAFVALDRQFFILGNRFCIILGSR